jgi:hypothetical protein
MLQKERGSYTIYPAVSRKPLTALDDIAGQWMQAPLPAFTTCLFCFLDFLAELDDPVA